MGCTIDIDTGGTFTDGFFVHGDKTGVVKVPTTPHDLTVCFLKCIEGGAERLGLSVEDLLYHTDIIRFSNTIGTNTIIQRDGAKIGLLVTSGREALAPTQSQEGKSPLVSGDMVVGIHEETDPSGMVIKAPGEADILSAAQKLIDQGARCLVAAFARSEFNPANERLVRRTIKREYPRDYLGSVPVFLSSDISRRSGEAERINAAVLNAYIHSKLVRLLYQAGEDLRKRFYRHNLFIVHNNGAVARVAKTRAINTYNSGPAAGLLGARMIGRLYGEQDLISADMGGTSFDLGYVRRGQCSYTLKPDVEGFSANVPMLSIRAIGAGGGSIAAVADNVLRVGPRSAGALPGPACFDLGGSEPTVSDADLILGILDPAFFLGGAMKLNASKARAVMEDKVAKPLGVSVEEAALAVKNTIDDAMGRELMKLKEDMGSDHYPTLVMYGGAGPGHCCAIARRAGLKKIIVTSFSSVFSAFSSLSMDIGHLYYRRVNLPLDAGDLTPLAEAVAEMEREAIRDMRGEGFSAEEVTKNLELFVKPEGNGYEFKMEAPPNFYHEAANVKAVAERAREILSESGRSATGKLMLGTASLLAQAPAPHYEITPVERAEGTAESAIKGTRQVFLDKDTRMQSVRIYDRALLGFGHTIEGPAIVESEHTSVLVSSGWKLDVDRFNNIVLEEG